MTFDWRVLTEPNLAASLSVTVWLSVEEVANLIDFAKKLVPKTDVRLNGREVAEPRYMTLDEALNFFDQTLKRQIEAGLYKQSSVPAIIEAGVRRARDALVAAAEIVADEPRLRDLTATIISAEKTDNVADLRLMIERLRDALIAERQKGEVTTGNPELGRIAHLDKSEGYLVRVERLISFLGSHGSTEPDWPWDAQLKELMGAILNEAFTAGLYIGQHLQLAKGKQSEADSIMLETRDKRAREGGKLGGQKELKDSRYKTLEDLLRPLKDDFRDLSDKGKVKLALAEMRKYDAANRNEKRFHHQGNLLSAAWAEEFCANFAAKLAGERKNLIKS